MQIFQYWCCVFVLACVIQLTYCCVDCSFFELFEKYGGFKNGHLKLKQPQQLQEMLDIARFLLTEFEKNADPAIEEKKSKLMQLKTVLEM